MFLLAHPLQPHRPARHGARQQGSVGRGIVGGVVAVTAGAFGMDATHFVFRHAEHFGDRAAQRINALRVTPDRHGIAVVQRDSA